MTRDRVSVRMGVLPRQSIHNGRHPTGWRIEGGFASVEAFAQSMAPLPGHVTEPPCGKGFCELATMRLRWRGPDGGPQS